MLGLGLSLTSRAVLGGGIAVPTILFSGSTVAEDAALDQVIGTLSVSNGSGSYTFTLTGSDGSRVSLTTATIKRGATALDYETHPTITFSVSADNGVDTPLTRTFNVTVTNVIEDTAPDAFSFTDVTDATRSTQYESNTITVAGIDGPANLTITGGEYSKNGGTYASSATTVVAGDTVKVRQTSPASFSTAGNVVLTIGGVSDTFTVTTEADPDAVVSDITLAWVSAPDADVPEFDLDFATPAALQDGDVIRFKRDLDGGDFSSPSLDIAHPVTQSEIDAGIFDFGFTAWSDDEYDTRARHERDPLIGDWSNTEDVVIATSLSDTVPDAFSFTDVTGATVSTLYESNTITVAGIDAPASLTITGGEYSINGGTYASSATTVSNGDTVKVRQTSSASDSTTTDVVLTIGGVSDTYSVATAAGGATAPRYWEFAVDGAIGTTGIKFGELQLRTNTVNKVGGITPTVRSSYDAITEPPSNLTDGNIATYWESDYSDVWDQWIRFDLGSGNEADIDSIALRVASTAHAPSGYTVTSFPDNTFTGGTVVKTATGLVAAHWAGAATALTPLSILANRVTNGDFGASGVTTDWVADTNCTIAVVGSELELTALAAGDFIARINVPIVRNGLSYTLSAKYRCGAGGATGSQVYCYGSATGFSATTLTPNSTTSNQGSPVTNSFTASAEGEVLVYAQGTAAAAGDKIYASVVSLVTP